MPRPFPPSRYALSGYATGSRRAKCHEMSRPPLITRCRARAITSRSGRSHAAVALQATRFFWRVASHVVIIIMIISGADFVWSRLISCLIFISLFFFVLVFYRVSLWSVFLCIYCDIELPKINVMMMMMINNNHSVI